QGRLAAVEVRRVAVAVGVPGVAAAVAALLAVAGRRLAVLRVAGAAAGPAVGGRVQRRLAAVHVGRRRVAVAVARLAARVLAADHAGVALHAAGAHAQLHVAGVAAGAAVGHRRARRLAAVYL